MSIQNLISGAECGVSTNPLAQVLKHSENDRSLQQDRISGPSSSGLRQLPRTINVSNDHDIALARHFFDGTLAQQGPLIPDSVILPHPSNSIELSARQHGVHSNASEMIHEAWKSDQQRTLSHGPSLGPWAQEFSNSAPLYDVGSSKQHQNTPVQVDRAWAAAYSSILNNTTSAQRPLQISHGSMYMPRAPMGMYNMGWSGNYTASFNAIDYGKGKGKAREIDFEAAFEQITASLASTQSSVSRIEEVEEVGEGGQSDFAQIGEEFRNSSLLVPEEDKSKWEADFNQLMSSQRDELEYGTFMQEAWENGLGTFSIDDHLQDQHMRFDDEGIPLLPDYTFEKINKYVDQSSPETRSLLQDAKTLLDGNGSLSEAALMLEAAIQKGDLGEGGYEAWILLGDVRTMDEREDAGMRAMMQGVRLAEAAGIPGPGMLSLAISFTNESYNKASHVMLLRWLRATYPDYSVPEETIQAMKTHSAWDTHSRMTDLFIGLARAQHGSGVVDADVQVALGILFYTNGEYDRAKDCFETALSVRPKDYLLWNRLGSSLSNGHNPEESLGAYREALSLRPTYTRAIYNVGVACLNIGAFKESAEHFLSALSLQEMTNGDTSDQLWQTLRRALEAMERSDLSEVAKAKGSLDVFRREGFDF